MDQGKMVLVFVFPEIKCISLFSYHAIVRNKKRSPICI